MLPRLDDDEAATQARRLDTIDLQLSGADPLLHAALKAQSQSRATLETLAMIKNPPVVHTRQANIANWPQ